MPAFLAPPALLRAAAPCRPPRCAAEPPAPDAPAAPPGVLAVAARLRRELPALFSPSGAPDFSVYAPSVVFEDPLTRFSGVSRYAANIAFLTSSPVFSRARLVLYDTRVSRRVAHVVRTRWALRLTANLPWRPSLAFTGQSDYVVDPVAARVVRHVDYWDSLPGHSAFFSPRAVRDVLAQCRPRLAPHHLPFRLLRRAPDYQIRHFHPACTLRPAPRPDGLTVWQPDPAAPLSVSYAAVVELPRAPQSPAHVHDIVTRLRAQLHGKPFAHPADASFYVQVRAGPYTFHEVWLQLHTASANVEE